MTSPIDLVASIRAAAVRPDADALSSVSRACKAGSSDAWPELVGALVWAGYASPGATSGVYDTVANGWLGSSDVADVDTSGASERASMASAAEVELSETFWVEFEAAVARVEVGYDATSITQRSVHLGSLVDPGFAALALDCAEHHPGAVGAAEADMPGLVALDDLVAQPDASLARTLHAMWVDNNFDPEVLDRDAIGLAQLPPALAYLNTRILQMHDVWHLMAGYETTALGEVAISAFQLAQFGHNYSAHFLPFALTLALNQSPEGATVFMTFVAEAWVHGRRTPPLMAIDWEAEWHRPIGELRATHGIDPFVSSLPQDLAEMMRSGG